MGTLIFIIMLIIDSKRKGEEISTMDIFDKISDTVISTSKTVGKKAKDVSGMAKIQLELRDKKMMLTSLYAELGEKYYSEHKDENLAEFEEIKAILEKIADLENNMQDIKGFDVCDACGEKIPEGAAFCPACGAKVEKPVEEPVEEAVEAEEVSEEKADEE